MPTVCCVVSDLIFATKIRGTAEALGVDMTVVRNRGSLLSAIDGVKLLIIDLNLEGDDPLDLIRMVRNQTDPPRIITFCSHVQTDLADQAGEAGADQVLPRSQFSSRLAQILTAGPDFPD